MLQKKGKTVSADTCFLQQHKLAPRLLQQSQDIQTQLALVAAGLGIALVPKSAQLICDKQRVTLLPLSGLYTQWKIGVIWNSNIKNKERDLFIKIITEKLILNKQLAFFISFNINILFQFLVSIKY
ncbi:hypothetical protein IC611_01815 [Proteus mirabilis]